MEIVGRIWAVTADLAESLRSQTERLGSLVAALKGMQAAPPDPPRAETRAGAVAIIRMVGMVSPRVSWYGVSAEGVAAAFRGAVADADVKAILVDIQSPGGEVGLVTEAAEAIFQARKVKPVVAVANPLAASAAYWMGSQATEFLVTPSGEAGSIGVYGLHLDMSGALEQAGLKVKLIKAGKYKDEGNPFEPLSEEAEGAIQQAVDRTYDAFVRDVARGRRVSIDVVRSGFGEGRVVGAKQAVDLGMADGVATLQDAVKRVASLVVAKRREAAALEAAIAARVELAGRG